MPGNKEMPLERWAPLINMVSICGVVLSTRFPFCLFIVLFPNYWTVKYSFDLLYMAPLFLSLLVPKHQLRTKACGGHGSNIPGNMGTIQAKNKPNIWLLTSRQNSNLSYVFLSHCFVQPPYPYLLLFIFRFSNNHFRKFRLLEFSD